MLNNFFLVLGKSRVYFYIQVLSNILHSLFEFINILSITAIILLFTNTEFLFEKLEKYLGYLGFLDFIKLDTVNALYIFSFIFFITTILKFYLKWLTLYYNNKIEYHINNKIYEYFLRKDYIDTLNIESSRILNILNYQVSRFANSFVGSICIILNSITLLVILIITIILFDGLKVLIFFSFLMFATYFVYYLFKGKIKKLDQTFTEKNLFRQNLLSETIYNIKYLKISKIYKPLLDKFREYNSEILKSVALRQISLHIAKPIIEIIFLFFFILYFYMNLSDGRLDFVSLIPQLSFYLLSFYRIMPALQQLYQSAISIKGSFSAFEDITDKKIIIKEKSKKKNFKPKYVKFSSKIILKNVKFKYKNQKNLFNNLNLKIKKNIITGIYGPSGSGKSTLIDIIIGLIKPDSGKIYIDKERLKEQNLDSWQNKIGYLGQSFYIINDNIINNICLNSSEINKKKAIKILKLFFSKDEIKKNIGFLRKVGENGNKLSFGQRQRLVLARLFYQDKSIIILDEPTSSLDYKNIEKLMVLINNLKTKKTFILITHDKRVIDKCDNLVKINLKV